MAEYRELHYVGDVTADLVPGEPLGWDATQRPYVIVQAWYDPPPWRELGTMAGSIAGLNVVASEHVEPGKVYVAPLGTDLRGRTTVVLAHPTPEQVRGWIDAGTWHPQAMESRRLSMQLAAHRADLREVVG